MVLTTLKKAFGKRLAAARVVAGFEDAEALARDLEIKPAAYRKYERGESVPPIDVLIRIKKRLRVTLDWLVAGDQ